MDHKTPSRLRRLLSRRVPIVSWLPQYSADKAICDLIAGVTVGLTLMVSSACYRMDHKTPSRLRRLLSRRVPVVSWLPQYSADKAICDLIAGVTVGLTLMALSACYRMDHKTPSRLRRLLSRRVPVVSWLPQYSADKAICDLIAGVTVGLTLMALYACYRMDHKTPSRLRRLLSRRVPVVSWLPQYSADKAICDLIAGVTVGLTLMPQALAYAVLAGLEPQYGLYSSFMGCFVYTVFGSCKDITIGPTALMALMTYQQIIGRNPDFAVLLCFLTGVVQILMAVLHLGVLIDFISIPVTVGFTSATSVIIAVSQLKGLLGLKFESSGFLDTLRKVCLHIHEARFADSLLGGTCIVLLLLLRKVKDVKFAGHNGKMTDRQRVLSKAMWLLSTARNALAVVMCSCIAYWCHSRGHTPFVLTGTVRSGLPSLQMPPFTTSYNNRTLDIFDMCCELGSSIVLVPIISVLGNVAIAKAFASGDSVDATQELFTLGLCNMLGSFVSSMPVTGSFSRSAVNHASGVRTSMGGLYTGFLILLALGALTPYFFFIPKAALAAVIICAVIFMIEYEVVKPMWQSSKKDLIPTVATFLLCLVLGVEYGILVGVGVNIVLLIYPSARPYLHIEKATSRSGGDYLLVTPDNSLYFPAVDFMRARVDRAGVRKGQGQLPVVVDCRYILGADFTAAKGIASLILDFSRRKQPIYFYNPRPSVLSVLKGVCLEDFVHISTEEELDYIIQENKKSSSNKENHAVEMSELEESSYRRRSKLKDEENKEGSHVQQPLLRNGLTPTIVRNSNDTLEDT